MKTDVAIFLAEDTENVQSDIISNENYFIFTTTDVRNKKDIVKEKLRNLKKTLDEEKPCTLSSFEDNIQLFEKNLEYVEAYSLVGALIVGDIVYIVTRGSGSAFLHRRKLYQIIEGDNAASGKIKEGDYILLTTDKLFKLIEKETFERLLDGRTPSEIIEDVTLHFKKQRDEGLVIYIIKILSENLAVQEYKEELETSKLTRKYSFFENKLLNRFSFSLKPFLQNKYYKINFFTSNKRNTFIVLAIIIIAILLWSVVFGYRRRMFNEINTFISEKERVIENKLQNADEIAPLDISRAQTLIREAKNELNIIKNKASNKGFKKLSKISFLEKKIIEKEAKIKKEEKGELKEYYDISLIDKKAYADYMIVEDKTLIILDKRSKKIYLIDSDSKEIKTLSGDEIAHAISAAAYNNEYFLLLPEKGIYKTKKGESKFSFIISNEGWGNPVDISVYNGNIYVLDKLKDEIFKYIVVQNGYSSKHSYFNKGQSVDLDKTISFSIDGAIYIAYRNKILKYLSGVREEFNLSVPDIYSISDIYTSKYLENLYILDKNNGKIIITSKNGEFRSQIINQSFKKTNNFGVLPKGTIVVLIGKKIYSVRL